MKKSHQAGGHWLNRAICGTRHGEERPRSLDGSVREVRACPEDLAHGNILVDRTCHPDTRSLLRRLCFKVASRWGRRNMYSLSQRPTEQSAHADSQAEVK